MKPLLALHGYCLACSRQGWRGLLGPLLFVALLPLLLLALWSGLGWQRARALATAEAAYREPLVEAAQALEDGVWRQLQQIDLAILALRQAEAVDARLGRQMARAVAQALPAALAASVTVVDARGRVQYSDLPGREGLTLDEQPWFRLFAAGGSDRLYLGEPFPDAADGQWRLPLARPLLGQEGRGFRGVLLIHVQPRLLAVHSTILPTDSLLTLYGADGLILGRSQEAERYLATRAAGTWFEPFRQARHGYLLRPQAGDQSPQGMAWRWVRGYPLIVLVSRGEAPLLQGQALAAGLYERIGVGVSLLLLLGWGFLARMLWQQRRTELALRRERAHLEDGQRIAHLGSWEWHLGNGEMWWSAELYRLLHFDPETVTPSLSRLLGAVLPEDRARLEAVLVAARERGAAFSLDFCLRRSDASLCEVRAEGRVTHASAGASDSVLVGTVLDVTEINRLERALRETEERWKLALQGSRDGVWEWWLGGSTGVAQANPAPSAPLLCATTSAVAGVVLPDGVARILEGARVFLSPRWKELLGYRPEEVTDSVASWVSLLHAEDREPVLRQLEAFLRGQSDHLEQEYRLHCRGGRYKWLLSRGAVIERDPLGRPLRLVGTLTDMTDRKEIELALAQEQSQVETLLSTLHEAVLVVDADARITLLNARAADRLGLSADDLPLAYAECGVWLADEADAETGDPLLHCLRTGSGCQLRLVRATLAGGQVLRLLCTCRPLCHPGDSLPHAVMVCLSEAPV